MEKLKTLSEEIDTKTNWKDGSKNFILVEDVKEFIKINEGDIDKEFIRAKKGIPEVVASVLYMFKQQIKGKMRKRAGDKLI